MTLMDIDPEIERALVERRKIVAIKRYRLLTGAGLRDSKNAVDEYERRLRALGRVAPEPAATPHTRLLVAGIYAVAVALGLLIAVGVRAGGIAGGLLIALAIFGATLLAGRFFSRQSKPGSS